MPDDWDERDDVVAARPLSGAERVCPGAISCRVARPRCGPTSAGHRAESVPAQELELNTNLGKNCAHSVPWFQLKGLSHSCMRHITAD